MSSHAWDEWLAAHGAVKTGPKTWTVTIDQDADEEPYVWVHPCGCLTDAPIPMYPVCQEHRERAVFLGRRGDGYVTTGAGS